MNRFMIESPHTLENCKQAIQDIYASGYLHFFDWGCKDDDHTAWAIVEAETADDARQMIPWYLREKARVVRLAKFDIAKDTLDVK